jgi:hypothetical protein
MSLKVNEPRETVPQSVPVSILNSAKYWSEWQDLNLRPPRPERGALLCGQSVRHRAGPATNRTRGRSFLSNSLLQMKNILQINAV